MIHCYTSIIVRYFKANHVLSAMFFNNKWGLAKMLRIIFINLTLLLSIILTGCSESTPNKIANSAVSKMYGKTIQATTYRQPAFVGKIPEDFNKKFHDDNQATGFFVGAIGTKILKNIEQNKERRSAGNIFIGKSNIIDPAVTIGEAIRNNLAMDHNMLIKTDEEADINFVYDEGFDVLSKQYPNTDYLLITKTFKWGFKRDGDPLNKRFKIYYYSTMKLLDLSSEKSLSGGKCNKKTRSYYLGDLIENKGELMKGVLNNVIKECTTNYLAENLKV